MKASQNAKNLRKMRNSPKTVLKPFRILRNHPSHFAKLQFAFCEASFTKEMETEFFGIFGGLPDIFPPEELDSVPLIEELYTAPLIEELNTAPPIEVNTATHSYLKRPRFVCKCGRDCLTKERLGTHMESNNCNLKRARIIEQPLPTLGCKLRECIDIHKRLKEREATDEAIK